MYCSNCGKQLSDTVKFCTGCGTPVEGTPKPQKPLKKPGKSLDCPKELNDIEVPEHVDRKGTDSNSSSNDEYPKSLEQYIYMTHEYVDNSNDEESLKQEPFAAHKPKISSCGLWTIIFLVFAILALLIPTLIVTVRENKLVSMQVGEIVKCELCSEVIEDNTETIKVRKKDIWGDEWKPKETFKLCDKCSNEEIVVEKGKVILCEVCKKQIKGEIEKIKVKRSEADNHKVEKIVSGWCNKCENEEVRVNVLVVKCKKCGAENVLKANMVKRKNLSKYEKKLKIIYIEECGVCKLRGKFSELQNRKDTNTSKYSQDSCRVKWGKCVKRYMEQGKSYLVADSICNSTYQCFDN